MTDQEETAEPSEPSALDWREEWTIPALLRGARRTYGTVIRQALAEAGHDDMPRNGSYVISAIARTGAPLGSIITALGVSKQAAGQLVDSLVLRGYLARAVDPEDRRRLTISLTERGEAASGTIRAAVEGVDKELVSRVGAEGVTQARAVLVALIEAGAEAVE
jgi:DNA-binding MarR family transcriptional regulator